MDEFGIAEWGYTEEAQPRTFNEFNNWRGRGDASPLGYLLDERGDKRSSLTNVYPDFASAVSFIFPYKPRSHSGNLKMGHYIFAYEGRDYHFVLKESLTKLAQQIAPDLEYKTIVDIEPVLERDLAQRAGLGWFGKNSMLINREHGSYFLIGSLLFNKRAIKKPIAHIEADHCGNCTACIDLCPTQAIDPTSRTLIVNKCISTFTIELFKEEKAPEGYEKTQEVFGCDICQDVCPWNNKIEEEKITGSQAYKIEEFFFKRPIEEVVKELEEISNREFKRRFAHTSLERTGRVGILKNLKPFLK